MNVREYSLTEIAAKIRNREVSCVNVVKDCLDQCRNFAEYNAFISVYEEQSVALAKAYDEMLDAGYVIGPLHGVPIALKDNIYLKGLRTTAGSKVLNDFKPEFDASVAGKLKGAGAIIIGKTNMHEFACGTTTANIHHGIAHNPWDFDKSPSGSSGGSGAAVAARCCYGALGTDTGGSVRLPAAMNGICGIRPSIGRVSNYGVVPLAYSQDTVGPMCRTVEDCALMFNIIAGHDYNDRTTRKEPVEDYTKDLGRDIKGLRVGVIKDYCFQYNNPDVEKCYTDALKKLEELGAVVREVEIPDLDILIDAQLVVDWVEPAAFHADWLRSCPEDYDPGVRSYLEANCMVTGAQYLQSLSYRTLLTGHIKDAFKDVDVIITPTVPFTATRIGDSDVELAPGVVTDTVSAYLHYTSIPSITGVPAMSVPAGFDSNGMPVGIMIIGNSFEERLLFRVGCAYQNATEFYKKAPASANL